MTIEKIDIKKTRKDLYRPSAKTPGIVEVPPMNFLMIDGKGDPNHSERFQQAIEALYGLAYTLKFWYKQREKPPGYHEYVVPPMEGLWWMGDNTGFDPEAKDEWEWTIMIMQPGFFTEAVVAEAKAELSAKKNPAALGDVYFERFEEGKAAQIMHIGPFSEEPATIERLHAFIEETGHIFRGKHHEIYLSDPRRTAPEKLKTVLRHPIAREQTG